MASPYDRVFEHLLRRAGFGARPDELAAFRKLSIREAVDRLINYERIPDDVDQKIGQPGHVGMTSNGPFSPRSVITDARQRWLFRMVHSNRPLQEKMTLFWHNHFATGYAKVAGLLTAPEATRYMAARPSEDPAGVRGQIEMLRDNALGNFRNLLVEVAKDTAMLVWLDGRQNVRARPQENFARELMELFTMGVNNFTESDVYAAARVFTGWNLRRPGLAADGTQHYEFVYNPNQHDTGEKTFSFAIYANGGKTIAARPGANGMQDGLDLIDALAASPHTARYLATKLYRFFVSESGEVSASFVKRVSTAYLQSRYDMKWVMREVLLSPEFLDERAYFARYAWPVEFVVRSLKDVGWNGFSLGTALAPLSNMGQNLFDPPDVNGWDQGPLWFSTGSMLARMNFASTLAANQRFNLANAAREHAATPQTLLAHVMESIRTAPLNRDVVAELDSYLNATGPWTATPAQLQAKVPALVHLIAGTPEYQFV
jgi:uncharacterized protein (DUF1800 family)